MLVMRRPVKTIPPLSLIFLTIRFPLDLYLRSTYVIIIFYGFWNILVL